MSSQLHPEQPPPLATLREAFSIQDRLIELNAPAVETELGLIERGLALSFDGAALLERFDPMRRALACEDVPLSERVIRGLLYGARAAIVSAVRLMLFGALIDAQSLLRSAFEAAYHAHYFRLAPTEVDEWIKLGEIENTDEFAKKHQAWQRVKQPRISVERLEAGPDALGSLFRDLSSYGTHANPKTAGLRLHSDLPRTSNVGYASTGYSEFTRICAMYTVTILRYVVSEYADHFRGQLSADASLMHRIQEFNRDVDEWGRSVPPGLSRLR